MKKFLRLAFAVVVMFFSISKNFAQCPPAVVLSVQNPSFEGTPQPHVTPSPWTNCLSSQTPDTQPGSWGVTLPATNGSSYLGLVHEPNSGWQEGAAQLLSSPMISGVTYNFTIDLANSSATGGGLVPGCIEVQIWGSNSACDQAQLLWSSGNVTPYDVWQTYTVSFTPTSNWQYINILSHNLGCSNDPYILVDNMSPINPTNVSVTTQLNNNVSCLGGNTGMATAHAVGLNLPFTFSWNSSPPQTDSVLDNVPAGTYTVTVTDASLCSATASVVIGPATAFTLTPAVTNLSCFGSSSGAVNITPSAGAGVLTYTWNPAAGNIQNRINVPAGVYSVTATDGSGCTASASATVTQPAQLTVTGTPVNATCSSTGSISTATGGGTPGYTYLWNTIPPQATSNVGNLTGGSYTVTVTDANTCTSTASFIVNAAPTPSIVTLTPIAPLCFGQNTGRINSTISGGAPNFTYHWSTIPVQTTANATNLTAGTYSVTVQDANNCTSSASATLSQPTAVSVSTVKTDVLCFGQSTGTATAMGTGGTGSFSYLWSTTPPQNFATAISLATGNYTVTALDANGCSTSGNVNISQPATPVSVLATTTNILCFGQATGSATATASGGTPGYTYNWSNLQSTPTISSLTAGSYSVTVRDGNNCSTVISSSVSQPGSPVTTTIALTAPLCFGQPAATVTANGSGGTGMINYVWSSTPPQNTATATNLPAGNYSVTATDANSCTATASVTLSSAPTPLTTTISHVDVFCYGASTGSVSVNVSGSYGGYTYQWNTTPVQTSPTASQLPAGNYSVTVTDLQGCSTTISDLVSEPATPVTVSATAVDVLCFGDATGSVTAVASGGTGAVSYVWSSTPVQNTATASALFAGMYTVSVSDANGCSLTTSAIVNQPAAPLAASQLTANVLCNGMLTGSISVTAVGGTNPYNYTWSINPSVNTSVVSNIGVGSYSVTVTDAHNCVTSINNIPIVEPPALTLNPIVTDVSCPNHGDGNIVANAAGGVTPYSYNWSNGGNTSVVSGLSGGFYTLTLTDANGCTVASSQTVIELPGVAINGNVTNVLCFPLKNGAINVNSTSSFMPLQFEWSTGQTTEDINALDTGSYSITVTDAHNCTVSADYEVANDAVFVMDATPDEITIDLGETVQLNVAALSSTLASAVWTPSYALTCNDCFNPVSSAYDDIKYVVNGVDVNGCTAQDEVTIKVIPKYVLFAPNAFTPNGDGNNDFFEVFGNKEAWKQFHVALFNRIGEKVYESENMNFKWDGSFKSSVVPGVYVYMIKVIYIDNYSEKLFRGSVTLIR